MSRTPVNQLADGQSVQQVFRLADKQMRVNRQGGKYLLLKLADRSGTIAGMMWNADEGDFQRIERGGYVNADGRVQVHNGNLQIIVTGIDPKSEKEVDTSDFDRFNAKASDQTIERLGELLSGMRNVHLRKLGQTFMEDDAFIADLRRATAAVSNHHAYPGGLVRHTVDLMELCAMIGPRYEGIDTELLMFGAFLHDLGKIEEISSSGELTYTDRGQLVGHIVIGVQLLGDMVSKATQESGDEFPSELQTQLEHLIVSHHGQLEFGSPRLPSTLEAIALHHIDNLDAKITSFASLIDNDMNSDENWTVYHPSIGRKLWKNR